MTSTLEPPTLDEIRAARERIAGHRAAHAARAPRRRRRRRAEIWLKLENLQPIGSFKLRGAANAMALRRARALARGVYTASAGNMAQGVAWCARAARRAVHRRRARPRAARQARRDRAARRARS